MKFVSCIAAAALLSASMAIAQNASAPIAAPQSVATDNVRIKSGETLAFLGDSITQFGGDLPAGYVQRVISGLKANGVEVHLVRAGISGHKSNQMLERLDRDVLSKKPTWMTLSCGVNDVMHGANGIELEPYKANITALVDKAQAAGVKVMILTATMIQEDPANAQNKKLAGYNDFLRQLAKERNLPVADLNADMQAALKPEIKRLQFTNDGVHMNPFGDELMAVGVLRAFGLNDAQIQKAREFWINDPAIACRVTSKADLTLRQYEQLNELATKQNQTVSELVGVEAKKAVEALLQAKP